MRVAQEIADSDDEDFSPLSSPAKPTQPAKTAALSSDKTSHATGSTDPRFFESVYDTHRVAVENGKGGASTGSSAEVTAESRGTSNSNMSRLSIDQTPSGKGDVLVASDPWAMPSSPLEVDSGPRENGRRMRSSADKKRRRDTGPLSPEARSSQKASTRATLLPRRTIANDVSESGRAVKKRRLDLSADGEDESDGDSRYDIDTMDMPPPPGRRSKTIFGAEQGPIYGESRMRSGNLVIEPSRLTSSQKDEYEEIEVPSSHPADDDLPPTAPMQPPPTKSSSASTVPFSADARLGRDSPADSSLPSTLLPPTLCSRNGNSSSSDRAAAEVHGEISSSPRATRQTRPMTKRSRPNLSTLVAHDDVDKSSDENDLESPSPSEERGSSHRKARPSRQDAKNREGGGSVSTARPKESRTSGLRHSDVTLEAVDELYVHEEAATVACHATGPVRRTRGRRQQVEAVDSEDDLQVVQAKMASLDDKSRPRKGSTPKKRGRPARSKQLGQDEPPTDDAIDEAGYSPGDKFAADELNGSPVLTKRCSRSTIKTFKSTEVVFDMDSESETPRTPEPPEPPKKKRGRPKRTVKALQDECETKLKVAPDEGESPDAATDLKASAMAKRRRLATKSAGDSDKEELDLVEESSKTSGQRLANQSATHRGKDTNTAEDKENAPTVKTEEKVTKSTTPQASALSTSKPLYRVGLSKRSRIAPLLKIIRKS